MNPMQMIINKIMSSPQMQNNPMAKNALEMYRNGDTKGLQNMAENLCRENGTTTEDVKNKIMQQFGMK